MFFSPGESASLPLIFVPLLIYASWLNFMTYPKLRWELFFLDFSLFSPIFAFIFGITLGAPDFFSNIRNCDPLNAFFIFLGMVCLSIGNQFFISSVSMAGIAIGYTIAIGSALIGGTVLTYIISPFGNVMFLAFGVVSALCAIICIAIAYFYRNKARKEAEILSEEASLHLNEYNISSGDNKDVKINDNMNISSKNDNHNNRNPVRLSIIYGALYAIFASAWSPLSTLGFRDSKGYETINAYSGLFFFCVGQAVGVGILSLIVFKYPLTFDSPLFYRDYISNGYRWHFWGAAASLYWAFGQLIYFLCAKDVGYSIAFAITQCNPLVATLIAVFINKEFKGSGANSSLFLVCMIIMYSTAIVFLTFSNIKS